MLQTEFLGAFDHSLKLWIFIDTQRHIFGPKKLNAIIFKQSVCHTSKPTMIFCLLTASVKLGSFKDLSPEKRLFILVIPSVYRKWSKFYIILKINIYTSLCSKKILNFLCLCANNYKRLTLAYIFNFRNNR